MIKTTKGAPVKGSFLALVESHLDANRQRGEPRMKLAELAERLGVSRGYLYFLTRGYRDPSDIVVERIADVLGKSEAVVRKALAVTQSKGR